MADRANVISHPETERTSEFGEIIRAILDDLSRIIRGEIQLARTEVAEKATRAGKAAGFLGFAAVTGLLGGACFVATCIAALALVMPVWLAALLTGILLVFTAAGAYAIGHAKLTRIDPTPQKTVQTLKEDIEWAKQRNK